jgi:acetyl-CoA synthetase (ADP-forming)
MLSFEEVQKVIKKYSLPTVTQKLVYSFKEAKSFAENNNFPLVLKIVSQNLLHKTEEQAVIVDIRNEIELRNAWRQLEKISQKKEIQKGFEGILIQKMVKGREVIIGAKQDQIFGPVLMFGLGGIFTEIYQDVAFRLAPITKKEALKLIKEIKAYSVLKGVRAQKPVNIEELRNLLVKISQLISKEKEIREIDLNPVIINEKEAIIVDVKVIMFSRRC